MEFNSVEYIIFLAAVFIIYQFINQRLRLISLPAVLQNIRISVITSS